MPFSILQSYYTSLISLTKIIIHWGKSVLKIKQWKHASITALAIISHEACTRFHIQVQEHMHVLYVCHCEFPLSLSYQQHGSAVNISTRNDIKYFEWQRLEWREVYCMPHEWHKLPNDAFPLIETYTDSQQSSLHFCHRTIVAYMSPKVKC